MVSDPYLRPGTLTLDNLLDIRDRNELAQVSNIFAMLRLRQGVPDAPEGELFSADHIKNYHHHLFQDSFAWAGETRTCSLALGDVSFCPPARVEGELNRLHTDLVKQAYLLGANQDEFCQGIASYNARLNWIHPFRDGNGRATRVMLEDLARVSNRHLDWSQTDRATWNHASYMAAATGDTQEMVAVFKRVVQHLPLALRTHQRAAEERVDYDIQMEKTVGGLIDKLKEIVLSGDYAQQVSVFKEVDFDMPARSAVSAGPGM